MWSLRLSVNSSWPPLIQVWSVRKNTPVNVFTRKFFSFHIERVRKDGSRLGVPSYLAACALPSLFRLHILFYSAPTVLLLFCFPCFPYLIRIKDISNPPSNCQKALINSTQNHTVKDACTSGRNAKQGRKGWRKAGQKDVKFATLTFPDPRVHKVVLVARHVAPAPSEREPARLTISFSAAISLDPLPSEWTHI